MAIVLLPLLAVVVIALGWLLLANRSQREPASSVAQFSRALTALAPVASVPTDPDPDAAREAS